VGRGGPEVKPRPITPHKKAPARKGKPGRGSATGCTR
jgi:hypothetical protein